MQVLTALLYAMAGGNLPLMDWFSGLRGEWEVLRRAPWTLLLVAAIALTAGFGGGSFIYERQIQEAQQAATTAQQHRDFWKDRYEEATKAPRKARAMPARVPPNADTIDMGRTSLLIAGTLSVVLATALLIATAPWKRRKRAIRSDLHGTADPLQDVGHPVLKSSEPSPPPMPSPVVAEAIRRMPLPNPDRLTQDIIGHDFLSPRPGEVAARPQVKVLGVSVGKRLLSDRSQQVFAEMVVENATASNLPKCTVTFVSYVANGTEHPVNAMIGFGQNGEVDLPIPANGKRNFQVLRRRYNVAPEEPMRLAVGRSGNVFAPLRDLTLKDRETYHIKMSIDSGGGVVTRVIFKATVGEYEDLSATLTGQAWMRSEH